MNIKTILPMIATSAILANLSCSKSDASELKNQNLVSAVQSKANVLSISSSSTVEGWASENGGTTGGGTSTAKTVTTYAALASALNDASVSVIQVSGTIKITERIAMKSQSNKTIVGLSGAKLVATDQTASGSGIINMTKCKNIILRNIIFEGPGAYDTDGWDNLVVDNSTNIWVDHCSFDDGVDDNFDIKNKADYITVSYCKFFYSKTPKAGGSGGTADHRFSNLIGSSDGATGDAGHLRVTFMRCWWGENCKERMPRVRYGKVQVVNSYFSCKGNNKCIAAGYKADILVQNNVFENVKEPISLMTNYTGVTATGNIFTNVTGNTSGSGASFVPAYTLTLLDASAVKSEVTVNAGATL